MDPSTIPIGETRVLSEDANMKIVINRITREYATTEHINPVTDRVVLRVRNGINSDFREVEYVDHKFWKFTVDGQPFTSKDLPQGNWKIDVETRTINITT